MTLRQFLAVAAVAFCGLCSAQSRTTPAAATREFLTVDAPVFVLRGVRVIDGTGAPPREDMSIVVRDGSIEAIGDSASLKVPAGAQVLERKGYTVLPGLVAMHEHMFYTAWSGNVFPGPREEPGVQIHQMSFSFPRLYLAAGITTLRTAGSVEPYADLNLKNRVDEGRMPGPKMHLTAPYLEGAGTFYHQMHELTGPDDARRLVDYWAREGMTSFKAYTNITRAELAAAIEEAHKRRLKITGHLCSVTFPEAAALGIDDLEHGFLVDTEFYPAKQPDVCPPIPYPGQEVFLSLDAASPQVQNLFQTLIQHRIAITSTLAVFELRAPGRPPLAQRVLDAMTPTARMSYLEQRALVHADPRNHFAAVLKKEMELERAFVKAGGVLLAGCDPSGIGGALAGFGNQRGVELLVEAGFTPVEAIRIATLNGAQYLGEDGRIGALTPGKSADMILVRGNPAARIEEIENAETVFKDGFGYDSAKLIASVREMVGLR